MRQSLEVSRIPLLLTLLLCALPAGAQTRPEAFLAMAPPLPANACGTSRAEQNAFARKARELESAIDEERTAKERRASKRQRSGETMARAPTGPVSGAGLARIPELMQQMRALATSLSEKERRLKRRFEELDASTKPALAEMAPLGLKLGEGSVDRSMQAAERKRLEEQLAVMERRFCERFSPLLLAILSDYRDHAKAAIQDYYRMEEMEAEIGRVAGADAKGEPGKEGMKPVRDYVRLLPGAFKYNLDASVGY